MCVGVNVPEAIAHHFDVARLFANSDEADMLTRALRFTVNLKLILVIVSLLNELLKCLNILLGIIPLDTVPDNKPRFVAAIISVECVGVLKHQ